MHRSARWCWRLGSEKPGSLSPKVTGQRVVMTRDSPTREELIAQLWVGIKTQANEPVMALETSYTYEDYRQDSDTSDVTQ